MREWLQALWYRPQPPPAALRPLAVLYGSLASWLAARRRSSAVRLPVPVIVVGNISVGGTGKTPMVVWLVECLRAQGWRPGVVSRGHGGRSATYPLRVLPDTDPHLCGDEPALLARRLRVPLAVSPDRVAAARLVLEGGEADILVADDGLQHHRLARDLEFCVVDGRRGLGNRALLPAGPLREPEGRLAAVDLVVVNGGGWRTGLAPCIDMVLEIVEAVSLVDGRRRSLSDFRAEPVHAIAGIGHPQRFFSSLRDHGLEPVAHPFPDHHRFVPRELDWLRNSTVLMTEKDAVKCAAFAQAGWWYVPAQALIDAASAKLVQQLLDTLPRPPPA